MIGPDRSDDRRIDDLVRQAAAFPTDDARLDAAVRRRIAVRARQGSGQAAWFARALPAPGFSHAIAFALVLAVTPVAVARLPLGAGDPALALMSALALGDPGLVDPALGAGLGSLLDGGL